MTGGAGFIGSHLVDAFTSRGCRVMVLDNLSSSVLANIESHLKNGECKFVKGDVRNMREVREASRDIDTIVHLAAITSVPFSVENPLVTEEVNARGTRNLLEASIDNELGRFVLVSTCAVYGEPRYLPIDEDHPINTMSPYADSKAKAEKYCTEFHEKYGLRSVTLRLFNVYGPRQGNNEYSGVITKFLNRIKERKPPIIYGDGEQTRDFVHVSDVVDAILLSIDDNNVIGQALNIGSGKSVSINRLCQIVLQKLNSEMKPIYAEPRLGDIRQSCASILKARDFLGYRPRTSIEEGLGDLTSRWV